MYLFGIKIILGWLFKKKKKKKTAKEAQNTK